MNAPVDSGFELVVIQGESLGRSFPLRFRQITLGRQEAEEPSDETVLTFAEPTVSRVHACLEWDEEALRYTIEHLSRTNPTALNGAPLTTKQTLQAGDRIKLGLLVVELRVTTKADAETPAAERPRLRPSLEADADIDPITSKLILSSSQFLVVLSGPHRGKVCPLTHPRMPLKIPEEAVSGRPAVVVAGVAEWNVDFIQQDNRLFIECMERPGLLMRFPGLVYDRLIGSRERAELTEDTVLICGDVALTPADRVRAELLTTRLRSSLPSGDTLVDRMRPGAPPYWPGTNEFILRVLSGPDRGSTLWIDPPKLSGPIRIGPVGASGVHVEIPDREAATIAISYTEDGFRICNVGEQNFNHNWEILRNSDEAPLVSGDRITMGRTMLSFEHIPLQARIESLAVFHGNREMPLVRAVNHIGYRPENELRIDDRRLGPRHGIVGVHHGQEFYYRHLNPDSAVTIVHAGGDSEHVATGEQRPVRSGDKIVLCEGIEISLAERVSTHRPSDPVLIGPTQKQIAADLAARKSAAASEG